MKHIIVKDLFLDFYGNELCHPADLVLYPSFSYSSIVLISRNHNACFSVSLFSDINIV